MGTKVGCNKGECGTCSVILNGKVVRSCIQKFKRIPDESKITTIEGVGCLDDLHPLQLSWMIHGAAQCGFCTPGFIMSAIALLDENLSPTRVEVRDWFQKHRNLCRCTGYIPIVDAVMDAARLMRKEVTVKDLWFKLKEGDSLLGSEMIRPTALAKVTGTWEFGADLGHKLPENTLHIKLVQAAVSHANILSVDTSEAEKMPGVFKVITAKDVPGTNRINGLAFPQNKGDGLERPILNDKKVFQFGDAIAMVLADTEAQAEEAAKKVVVELEELLPYMSAPAAMAEDAIEIHPGTPNIYFTTNIVKGGETASLMESLPNVIQDDFYVGRQPHLPLEPDVGFAYMDEDDNLMVHSKSIALHFHQLMTAEGIGVPADKYFIVQNPTGATFGYKFSPTNEALLGVAAFITKRPVFLEFNMFQQITYTGKRSPFFMNVKMGADKDGKIKAMESDWSVDHGPYCEFGDLVTTRGSQFIGAGYNIPNIRGEGRTVCTNHGWGSAFRGYGSPQSLFSSETLIDMLADKMGVDPFELRYANVYREGDTTPNSGPVGGSRSNVLVGNAIKVGCENLLAVLKKADGSYRTYDEMVAEKLPLRYEGKWTAPCTAPGVETSQGNPFAVYMYGVLLAEVAVDTKTGKTQVEKLTLVSDCGTITNKLVIEGQLYGGLTQGIGLALSEDFEDLKKHTTLVGCGIPQVRDVPDQIVLIHQETPRPLGPYGCAGSGEMPLSAPHAAIANAIFNASGVRIKHLPALPEKVLTGLKAL